MEIESLYAGLRTKDEFQRHIMFMNIKQLQGTITHFKTEIEGINVAQDDLLHMMQPKDLKRFNILGDFRGLFYRSISEMEMELTHKKKLNETTQ